VSDSLDWVLNDVVSEAGVEGSDFVNIDVQPVSPPHQVPDSSLCFVEPHEVPDLLLDVGLHLVLSFLVTAIMHGAVDLIAHLNFKNLN